VSAIEDVDSSSSPLVVSSAVALLDALYAFFRSTSAAATWTAASTASARLDGDTCGAVINSARTMTDQRGRLLRSPVVC